MKTTHNVIELPRPDMVRLRTIQEKTLFFEMTLSHMEHSERAAAGESDAESYFLEAEELWRKGIEKWKEDKEDYGDT